MGKNLGGKMKYKYIYKGNGILSFFDSDGKRHVLSYKDREIILESKLDIIGLERVELQAQKIEEKKEVKKEEE